MSSLVTRVDRYTLLLDRLYEPTHHLWVLPTSAAVVRVGLDPLAVEVNGSLAQIELVPVGTLVRRGEPFGHLEAAKFVGPLAAPLSGRIVAHNPAAADPRRVELDPFHTGWLVEMEPTEFSAERAFLLEGADQIVPWFRREVEEYRRRGVLAE